MTDFTTTSKANARALWRQLGDLPKCNTTEREVKASLTRWFFEPPAKKHWLIREADWAVCWLMEQGVTHILGTPIHDFWYDEILSRPPTGGCPVHGTKKAKDCETCE